MEIEFYWNQRLDEKKNAGGKISTWHLPITNQCPRQHSHQGLTFLLRNFDEILQLSSNLKFDKAELYLIDGCQDEWFELIYYVETLFGFMDSSTKQKNQKLDLEFLKGQY